jgi:hypothetical protein
MAHPTAIDPVHATVCCHAHVTLGRLLGSGAVPRPETVARSKAGWSMLLTSASSPGDGVPGLTPCEPDCLRLLSARPERCLKADTIRDELEAHHGAIHGPPSSALASRNG